MGYDGTLSPSFAPVHQFFASCARSSVAGRTVFTTLLENRFSKRTVFTRANEIGFPGLTIFTIVLKRAFLYAQFLQYFLRRGVKKQQKNNAFCECYGQKRTKTNGFSIFFFWQFHEIRCAVVQNHTKSTKTVVLSCFLFKIGANRCTVVQNR